MVLTLVKFGLYGSSSFKFVFRTSGYYILFKFCTLLKPFQHLFFHFLNIFLVNTGSVLFQVLFFQSFLYLILLTVLIISAGVFQVSGDREILSQQKRCQVYITRIEYNRNAFIICLAC
jgi:hypothetical protein